ncbi:hypothetical protein AU074_07490 [Pseudomonas sp. ATCC PTA-122608]|nr:hypothetical protein AU074_07490 [Pseudomonas sp. ATCC PTA-122608]
MLKARSKARANAELFFCGSGLAREKPEGAAFIRNAHVIVNDLREQARSHIWTAFAFAVALQHSSLPADLLLCRSELAREKPETAALNQDAHVIVNDLREQARSHI